MDMSFFCNSNSFLITMLVFKTSCDRIRGILMTMCWNPGMYNNRKSAGRVHGAGGKC